MITNAPPINMESTPLLPPKDPSKKQIVISQSLAAVYNVLNCSLYFVSANGFLKHLVESKDSPAIIQEQKDALDHNITDLTATWQYIVLTGFVFGSVVTLINNQRGMPARIQQMFGWQNLPKDEQNKKSRYIIIESALSGTWKGLVSATSLAALGAPYIGFWPSTVIALLTLPGNIVTQMTNSIEPFLKKIGSKSLHPALTKIGSAYSTTSNAVSNTGLGVNTLDQLLMRMGITDIRLLQIKSIPISLAVNVPLISWGMIYCWQTGIQYYNRINKIMKPAKEKNKLPVTNPENNEGKNIDFSLQPEINQKKFPFWKKVDKWGATAATYKATNVICALLSLIAIAYPLNELNRPTVLIFCAALVLFFANLVSQLTFYTPLKEPSAKSAQTQGVGKLVQCYGYLSKCGRGKDEAANRENIHNDTSWTIIPDEDDKDQIVVSSFNPNNSSSYNRIQ